MLARTAFGPWGSAQPGPSATHEAPNAWAERSTVPTLPGSPTRCRYTHSGPAAVTQRCSYTASTRVPEPSADTLASAARSTSWKLSSPRLQPASLYPSRTGRPARLAAAIRSSPSARKVPLRARSRLVCRRRTAFNRGFWGDSIWLMLSGRGVLVAISLLCASNSLEQQKGRRPFQERRPGGCLSFAGSPALAGSGSRRLAGDLGETSERLCVADSDVSEHLAVELHAGER